MSSKYTFHFNDNSKIVQERRGGESERHIVLKLLGYLLYYGHGEQRPQIEVRVTNDKRDYRPDVVAFDAEGAITLWIDCGQITLQKVDDLTRRLPHAALVVIKTTCREMEGYALQAAKKVKRSANVVFLGFDPEFVPALIGGLGHNNQLQWQRDGERLRVTLNGTEYATTLWRWDSEQSRAMPDVSTS